MTAVSGSLDANVLLRLIIRDVPAQSHAALNLIEHGQRFLVADTAVIETVFVLERYYQFPRAEIAEIMRILTGNHKLILNRELLEEALVAYTKFSKLSFEDCCLAFGAKQHGASPLWTFDEKLWKQLPGLARQIKVERS